MAKLNKLVGRMKGTIKEEAIAALGKGANAAAITAKANAIAKEKGYETVYDEEWIAAHLEPKTPKRQHVPLGHFTIKEVLSLAKDVSALTEKTGGKEGLEAVLDAIDKAGGVDSVKEILETM